MRVRRFALAIAACLSSAVVVATPAVALQPDTNKAAISTARNLVRYGGQLKTGPLYRLLAPRQKNLLSKAKFARCVAPRGSRRTGTHVIKVRRVDHRHLSVYGYKKKQSGVVVLMRVADSGGKRKRSFNGGLIYDRGHWHWYLRKSDIHRCR